MYLRKGSLINYAPEIVRSYRDDAVPARTCVLMMSGTERDVCDFRSVVSHYNGRFDSELSVVEFPIGGDGGFSSLTHLCDFVLGYWGRDAGLLRSCWIDPKRTLHEQLGTLVAARPLLDWVHETVTPLRQIIDEHRIETWYQPIFAGSELKLWGYECLARARDGAGALIAPGELFSWARKENLLFTLDRVCREQHVHNSAATGLPEEARLLINFLPTAVYDPTACLRNTVAKTRQADIDPARIIFEVVESERIADRAHLRRIVDECRKAGFGVALDDVGAGYSGLKLLAELAPDLIKIDRELVRCAVHSELHATVCKSIVEVGRAAGKLVLAEGVETQQEYRVFRDLGVDMFQGFLFGKPSPAPALTSQFLAH